MRVAGVLLVAACGGGDEPPPLAPSQPSRCPDGMVEVRGGARTLGETDPGLLEQYAGNVLPAQDYAVESYCIDRFPLPGEEGDAWPEDGLSAAQVAEIEALLPAMGRRLCTVTELLHAAAGRDNWRYPTDPEEWRGGDCDPDDVEPDPIGTWEDCESPWGVRDFQVRSTWGVLDEQAADAARDALGGALPEEARYVSWGGTARRDTYYAPSNFGFHLHAADEDAYLDDGLRTCADRLPEGELPDPDAEDAWRDWVRALREAGRFADVL